MKLSPTLFDAYLVDVKSRERLVQIFEAFAECPNFKDTSDLNRRSFDWYIHIIVYK